MRNSVTGVVTCLFFAACSGSTFTPSSGEQNPSTLAGGSDPGTGGETGGEAALASGGVADPGAGGDTSTTGGDATATGGRVFGTQGGANPTGGRANTGGRPAAGGRSNTGGRRPTGGANPTGGVSPTGGGPVATGGVSTSAGGTTGTPTDVTVYGDPVDGQYHLGPVDFAETEWPNACTPEGGYRQELRVATGLGGEYLAGLSSEHAQAGGTCDACILIKTATGRQIVARVVTYGASAAPGDIDVSPSVFDALNTGEYPRSMTWQFAKCPDTGPLEYEFQTQANPWWTSLWVRNPRVPITKVEVQSANHASFFTLRRETDGTLNDDNGFGEGSFTLRITAMDGQVITDTLPGFSEGQLIVSTKQFQ